MVARSTAIKLDERGAHHAVAAARRVASSSAATSSCVSDLEYDTGDDLQGPRVFLELGSIF